MDVQPDVLTELLLRHDFTDIRIEDQSVRCRGKLDSQSSVLLTCQCDKNFPYTFPKVFIDGDFYTKHKPLPHVNTDRSICAFDSAMASPDFRNAEEVICRVLIQSLDLIKKGISGVNGMDFLAEFLAYWDAKVESHALAESIVSVTEKTHPIWWFAKNNRLFLADTKTELMDYLRNVGIRATESSFSEGLYLPLSSTVAMPRKSLVTNLAVYNWLIRYAKDRDIYRKYVQRKLSSGGMVVFSVPVNGKRLVAVFRHKAFRGSVPGFRQGHLLPNMAFAQHAAKQLISRIRLSDMRQERLFQRGGVGVVTSVRRVAIIGCGSVGSFLAESLAEYGLREFVLVDPDILESGNLARHYCGRAFLGMRKADAVKFELIWHNPNLRIEAFSENGFSFVENHVDKIQSCDLIFDATGSVAFSAKLIQLVNQGRISKTVVLMWVEPYLVAGRALLLNRPLTDYMDLFYGDGGYFKSIVENSNRLYYREAGCQSTFLPYASFSLHMYIDRVVNELMLTYMPLKSRENYGFTWLGDMESAERYGCVIREKWRHSEKYGLHVKLLNGREDGNL